MIRLLAIACLATIGALVSGSVSAGACDKGPKDFFLYDTEPQAKRAGVDYYSALTSAFGRDKTALVALLQVTAAGTLDGAGAQTHAEVLWSLLQCWGDDSFAETLRAQSSDVRRRVHEQLLYATEERKAVRSSYPKTFRASGSKTSNRRIDTDRIAAGHAERWAAIGS